jgi:uncharacterized protein (DUF342 family)
MVLRDSLKKIGGDIFRKKDERSSETSAEVSKLLGELDSVELQESAEDLVESVKVRTVKEKLPAAESGNSDMGGDDDILSRLDSLKASSDSHDSIVSSMFQYPTQKRPQDPHLRFVVSRDMLRVEMVCYPHDEQFITMDEAKEELRSNNVVYGVDYNKIKDLLEQVNARREPVLGEVVARGKASVDGKDAHIEFFFPTSNMINLEEDEDGRIDFKDMFEVNCVRKDDLLAQITPPTEPEDGVGIDGKVIVGRRGKQCRVLPGKGCMRTEDQLQFFADQDGQPLLKGNKIIVNPVYSVPHDVDLSSGNISFVGTVIVNGSVTTGFSVTAEQDVHVAGVVEGARIVAGGSVFIKRGFAGGDKGKIIAKKDVTLGWCHNGEIISEGHIFVQDSVVNSHLTSLQTIRLGSKKGSIIGGRVRAVRGIWALNLGSDFGVTTMVVAGEQFRVKELLGTINQKQKLNQQNIQKIATGLKVLRFKMNDLTPDQKKNVDKLSAMLNQLMQKDKEFEQKKQLLLNQLSAKTFSKVHIKNIAHSNVRVQIGNSIMTIQDQFAHCSFSEDKARAIVKLGAYEDPPKISN